MVETNFQIRTALPIKASNGGLFISRSIGRHPDRTIDSYEIIVVRSGNLAIGENGTDYYLAAGDTLILQPGCRHYGVAAYPADLSFYWLHYYLRDNEAVQSGDLMAVPKRSHAGDQETLTALCRAFLNQQERGAAGQFRLDLILLEILDELAANEGRQNQLAVPHVARQADLFIQTHFHQKISARDIARHVGSNEDYLGRVYRRTFGMTLTEAVCRCRLRLACSRLLESTDNIDEIARAAGFDDPGYFRRVFRQAKGMSPTRFRKCFGQIHLNSI